MTAPRTEKYLQAVMTTPNRWVMIKKSRSIANGQSQRKERRQTFQEVLTALKIMQIPHHTEQGGRCYKIMMLDFEGQH